jgi:hypothetical protein
VLSVCCLLSVFLDFPDVDNRDVVLVDDHAPTVLVADKAFILTKVWDLTIVAGQRELT